jgi:ubiquinone/menaquinone biosynthesis C-methylase UbiE
VTQEDSVVVDLGAGDGTILDIVHAYSPRASLISIELSVEHLQTLQHKGYNPIQATASFVPIRNDVATSVLFLDVIEHLEEPSTALTDIHRILGRRAKCVITTPNKFGVYEYKELVYVGLPRYARDFLNTMKGKPRSYHPYHVRLYTLSELRKTVEMHSLEFLGAATIGFCVPFLGNLKTLADLLSVDLFSSRFLIHLLEAMERRLWVINFLIVLVCASSDDASNRTN